MEHREMDQVIRVITRRHRAAGLEVSGISLRSESLTPRGLSTENDAPCGSSADWSFNRTGYRYGALLVEKRKYEDTLLSHLHAYHSSQIGERCRDGSRYTYYHHYQMVDFCWH